MAFDASSTAIFAIVATLISTAYGLNCTVCSGRYDCAQQNKSDECTIELVNKIHSNMKGHNPNLLEVNEDLAENVTFKCFTIEPKLRNALPGESERSIVAGCTIERVNFCSGWTEELDVMKCGTCDEAGLCSSSDRNMISGVAIKISLIGVVLASIRVF